MHCILLITVRIYCQRPTVDIVNTYYKYDSPDAIGQPLLKLVELLETKVAETGVGTIVRQQEPGLGLQFNGEGTATAKSIVRGCAGVYIMQGILTPLYLH